MCTTSFEAFELGKKLIADYEERKKKEKEMNKRAAEPPKPKVTPQDGVSRTVTEIDYDKHERTVAELQRQEAEEEFNRKKAEASKWCTLDHEHGPECRQPVMGCSHDHQKEWQIYEKSTDEKLNAAERFKQEGNEAFRKHNYGLAAVHYRKALVQFDYTFAEGEEEEKRHDQIKLACLLNLAACKSHQEEWDDVLTQCRLALEINPRSVKAYYRTGLAHLARDQFELAKDALMSAYEIEPHNSEVLARLKQLKQNMADYKVKRKEVAKEMLSGADADGTPAASDGAEDSSSIPPPPPPYKAHEDVENEHRSRAAATADTAHSAEEQTAATSQASSSVVDSSSPVGGAFAADTAAAAARGDTGLRRRRPESGDAEVRPKASERAAEEEDGDEEEESLVALQGKAMRVLLITAAVLGVAALVAAAVAALSADS